MEFRNSKDALFRLIKAMDSGEKRFFNLYCKRYNHGGKVYIKLFKAIENQDKYDVSALKEQIKGHYGGQLPLIKSYLYNIILDSLLQYYNKDNKLLPAKMIQVRLLYEKGLIDLALKLIYKVRQLSEGQNDFIVALATIRWEVILKEALSSFNIKVQHEAYKLEEHYLHFNEEINAYRRMYHKVYAYAIKYTLIYEENVRKEFIKISDNNNFNANVKPSSIMASTMLYMCRGLYYELLGDNKIAFKELSKLVKILDSSPLFKNANFELASTAIGYYVASCLTQHEYELALERVDELRELFKNNPTFRMKRIFFNSQMQELKLNFLLGRKNSVMTQIQEMENKIRIGEISTEINKNTFYCDAAVYCTLLEEYSESLNWINKLLNSPTLEKSNRNIYSHARILQLINLLELKEYDLLSYRFKSLYRYLKNEKIFYAYEKNIMDLFQKFPKIIHNKTEQQALYANLKNNFVKITKNPTEALAASYFDFDGWLESKIKKMPYIELQTNKTKRTNN